MKRNLVLLLVFFITSCSVYNQPSLTKISENISFDSQTNSFIAKVSNNKGASIPVEINLKDSFSTKANQSGSPLVEISDISKIDVFLFKLPIGFSGTNPYGTSSSNLVASFSDIPKSGASFKLLIVNVLGIPSTSNYYVGVIIKNSSGNIINKPPSTSWTDETLTNNSSMILSNSGVGVDETTLEVTSTSNLLITPTLLDSSGTKIETNATVTNGSDTLSSVTAY